MTTSSPDANSLSTQMFGTGSQFLAIEHAEGVIKVWIGTGDPWLMSGWDSEATWEVPLPLPQQLEELRAAGDFSKTRLAEMLGVTLKTVMNWGTGKNIPSRENVRRIEAVKDIISCARGVTPQETAFRLLSRLGDSSILEDLASERVDSAVRKAKALQRLGSATTMGPRPPRRVFRGGTLPNPLLYPDAAGGQE